MAAKTCGNCRLYGANFYDQHSQPNTTCCADAVMDLPASFIPNRQTMKPDEGAGCIAWAALSQHQGGTDGR